MAAMDMKMALNAEIRAQGHSDEALSRAIPTSSQHNHHHHHHHHTTAAAPAVAPSAVAKKPRSAANTASTEWNLGGSGGGTGGGQGGTFQEHWPSHLPRPPSMKKLTDDDDVNAMDKPGIPKVIVFNANTQEGSSMVRVLSEKGLKVVAVVRVFTSRNAKNLIKLKNVTVKVADLNNKEAVVMAAEGCQQAFLVTKYWERFENPIEEQMAKVVLSASVLVGIERLVLATFEDTADLRRRGRKSQLVPTIDGRIFPSFVGMDSVHKMAQLVGVQLTNMMTSYLDTEDSKKSLILIRGSNGKIKVQDNIQPVKKKKQQQEEEKHESNNPSLLASQQTPPTN